MNRYRRNDGFRLLPTRPATKIESGYSISGRTVLGIVVNPKLKEPVLAITDGEYVGIRSLRDDALFAKIGIGYPSDRTEDAGRFTKLPRVHTPDGVRPRNRGYGTSLYSALCLGAHLTYEEYVRIGMKVKGDGVCSDYRDRSDEADAWWKASLQRGLTEERTEEIDERKENVNISGAIDAEALTRIAKLESADQRIVYVNDVDVDIEETSERNYDIYKHDSMVRHALLASSFVARIEAVPVQEQLSELWHAVLDDPQLIEKAYPESLLALDVRNLHPDAINLLSLLYIKAGLKDPAIDAMRERWERNLDPGHVSGQRSLFRANAAGMADVEHARQLVDWEHLEDLP